jgi:hypothetical protein
MVFNTLHNMGLRFSASKKGVISRLQTSPTQPLNKNITTPPGPQEGNETTGQFTNCGATLGQGQSVQDCLELSMKLSRAVQTVLKKSGNQTSR